MTAEHKTPSNYLPAPKIDFSTNHGEVEPPFPSKLLVSPTGDGEEYKDWSFLQQDFQERSAKDVYRVLPDGGLILGAPPQHDSGISTSWIPENPAYDLHQDSLLLAPQPVKKYEKRDCQGQRGEASVMPSECEHILKRESDSSGLSAHPTSKISSDCVDDADVFEGFWSGNDIVYKKNCDDDSLQLPDLPDMDPDILAPSSNSVDMTAVVKFLEEYVENNDSSVRFPKNLRSSTITPSLKEEPQDV